MSHDIASLEEAVLRELCVEYSNLTSEEVQELVKVIYNLADSVLYPDADVFIDIYNEVSKSALVVYHRQPLIKESMYANKVVGLDALLENEPGVLRSMQTGVNSIGLIAVSQEGKLITQSIYPIKLKEKTLGVLIIETDASTPTVGNTAEPKLSTIIRGEEEADNFFVDRLSENVLIFDGDGYLVTANEGAKQLYRQLGYRDEIIGMFYDNLTLDYLTFDYIKYRAERATNNWFFDAETRFLQYYFTIKYSWIKTNQRLVVIIQDTTEFKKREEEIVLKSVAIKEIHHRVKNNLQSIVSLLKIQERRAQLDETKKVLHDSISRIMTIASTHELLSQQVDSYTSLQQTLTTVIHNFHHMFGNFRDIEIFLQVDDNVYITTDQVVTVSLIVNELLQNIFDHAYLPEQSGKVQIIGKAIDSMISIEVSDDGCGFDVKTVKADSLGLLIINGYVKDKLKGKLNIESNKSGTKVNFRFQKSNDVVV